MYFRVVIILFSLCLSLSATAEFRTITVVHEIQSQYFSAPASGNSAAMFRECADCEPNSVRVTPATRYLVNNRLSTLAEFRKGVMQSLRGNGLVLVSHHLASDTIVEISVTF